MFQTPPVLKKKNETTTISVSNIEQQKISYIYMGNKIGEDKRLLLLFYVQFGKVIKKTVVYSSPEVIDCVLLQGVRFLLRLRPVAALLRSHHPAALLRSLQREKCLF
jgi:hypothetical protein